MESARPLHSCNGVVLAAGTAYGQSVSTGKVCITDFRPQLQVTRERDSTVTFYDGIVPSTGYSFLRNAPCQSQITTESPRQLYFAV